MLCKKTRYLLTGFLSASLLLSGCSSGPEETKLLDEKNREYTLIQNPDGTTTAKYEDGSSVTFKQEPDNSLHFLSGTESLLLGVAGGYLLSRGLHSSGMEQVPGTNRIVPQGLRAATYQEKTQSRYLPRHTPGGFSGTYRGFGSAGARSASS